MKQLTKFFYYFTSYFPRFIPTTDEEYEYLKFVLVNYYGVKDDARTWSTVIGHLTSIKSTSIRFSYALIANAANRLYTNEMLNAQRFLLKAELEAKLKAAMDKYVKENPEPLIDNTQAQDANEVQSIVN